MNATKSGVTYGSEDYLRIIKKAAKAVSLVGDPDRDHLLGAFEAAVQSFNDSVSIAMPTILKPVNFTDFLESENPSQGVFNQFASEINWWTLLDQIEEACFLRPENLAIARPFLGELWKGEIAANPYQPPKSWRYLPVASAIEVYQKIFGSALNADSTLDRVRKDKSLPNSEGIAVWPKLTTLARLFEIPGNPLENTEEGREAYARIVQMFIPLVGEAYVKTLGKKFTFANWREGQLTARHIVLTPASRKTWQELESMSDDDFVFASAISGVSYAGYSQRLARLRIAISGNQLPQDCIMTGCTLATQPERLCKAEHLRPDNPGNAYSPEADGTFHGCVGWCFGADGRQLAFGRGSADHAHRDYGSAVLLRP